MKISNLITEWLTEKKIAAIFIKPHTWVGDGSRWEINLNLHDVTIRFLQWGFRNNDYYGPPSFKLEYDLYCPSSLDKLEKTIKSDIKAEIEEEIEFVSDWQSRIVEQLSDEDLECRFIDLCESFAYEYNILGLADRHCLDALEAQVKEVFKTELAWRKKNNLRRIRSK